mgnify:CR=1 FL=1
MDVPFSAFLNDDYSIDLEFYQSIGEIEIVISQNGDVVYSSTENNIETLATDHKLVVAFDSVGEKTLLAKFAKLTKL